MRITRKQIITMASAVTTIAVLGGTGVAMAANSPAPVSPATAITTSDVPTPDTAKATSPVEANETVDATEGSDGADQGLDANLSEPGHQDANEANDRAESADADGDIEDADGTEVDEGTEANDANDAGELQR